MKDGKINSSKRGTVMFKSKLTIDDLKVGMHVVPE